MMSHGPPSQALQQRVGAILDGAARVIAVRGDQASMNDVAEAAGVARATVYRYFPNREVLLDELTQASVGDVAQRLVSARICEVAPEEAIARTVRALVEVGDSFVILAREHQRSDAGRFERKLTQPMRELFERGQASGDIRNDIASARLTESLIGLIVSVLRSTSRLGNEDMTAVVTGLFLDGARAHGPRLL
jgi:TetR/AcrR family transcriptional regulator, mexCD-oprJ operon repressor